MGTPSNKYIQKLLLLAIAYVLPACLFAQISDSLYKALPDSIKPKNKQAPTVAEQQRILKNASSFFSAFFAADANKIAAALQTEVDKSNDIGFKAESLNILGDYNVLLEKTAEAMVCYKTAIKLVDKSTAYNHALSYAYSGLAGLYYITSQNDDSTIYFLHQSLSVPGALGDSLLSAQSYNIYSVIYGRFKAWDKAILYGKLAINYIPAAEKGSMGDILCLLANTVNYASAFVDNHDKAYADTAEIGFRHLLQIKRNESDGWYAQIYSHLSRLAYNTGKFESAILYADSSLLPIYNQAAFQFPNNYNGT